MKMYLTSEEIEAIAKALFTADTDAARSAQEKIRVEIARREWAKGIGEQVAELLAPAISKVGI